MTKKIFLTFIIIFLSFSNNIFAQTQLEINETARKSYEKSDKTLNIVYSVLMKSLDKNESQKLILAQKNWIKFRDSHCEFEASQYEGGSIKPSIYYSCYDESTKKRIIELKQSIKERSN